MNTFLVFIGLFAALLMPVSFALRHEEFLDYRLKSQQYGASTYADETCNSTGLLCKNCKDLVYCTSSGDGNWTERPVTSCTGSQICLNGQCVTSQSAECSPTADKEFPCSSIGVFPNPGDCRYYHICYPEDGGILKGVKVLCENSEKYYYNPKTYSCDRKLPSNGKCASYPIPLCKTPGETAAIKENPKLYYICLPYDVDDSSLYPFQMACPNDQTFSSLYGRCR